MRILVLDDQEDRHAFFKKAYNTLDNVLIQSYDYDSVLLEIDSTPNLFDLMFLDHDLSDEQALCNPLDTYEKTGTDVAEFIVRKVDPTKCTNLTIWCHSMNPWGRANMVEILRKASFNVVDAPFISLKFDIPG